MIGDDAQATENDPSREGGIAVSLTDAFSPDLAVSVQARGILRDAREVLAEGAWTKARRSASQRVLERLHARLVALADRSTQWPSPPPGVADLARGTPDARLVEALRQVWPQLKPRLVQHWLHPRFLDRAHRAASAALDALANGPPGLLRRMNLARGRLGPIPCVYRGVTYGVRGQPDLSLAPAPPPLALLAGRALEGLEVEWLRELAHFAPRGYEETQGLAAFVRCWALVATMALRRVPEVKDAHIRRRLAVAGVALAAVVHAGDRERWLRENFPAELEALAAGRSAPAPLRAMARRLSKELVTASHSEMVEVLEKQMAGIVPPAPVERTSGTGRPIAPNSQVERVAAFLKKNSPRAFSNAEMRSAPELRSVKRLNSVMTRVRARYPAHIHSETDADGWATFWWAG